MMPYSGRADIPRARVLKRHELLPFLEAVGTIEKFLASRVEVELGRIRDEHPAIHRDESISALLEKAIMQTEHTKQCIRELEDAASKKLDKMPPCEIAEIVDATAPPPPPCHMTVGNSAIESKECAEFEISQVHATDGTPEPTQTVVSKGQGILFSLWYSIFGKPSVQKTPFTFQFIPSVPGSDGISVEVDGKENCTERPLRHVIVRPSPEPTTTGLPAISRAGWSRSSVERVEHAHQWSHEVLQDQLARMERAFNIDQEYYEYNSDVDYDMDIDDPSSRRNASNSQAVVEPIQTNSDPGVSTVMVSKKAKVRVVTKSGSSSSSSMSGTVQFTSSSGPDANPPSRIPLARHRRMSGTSSKKLQRRYAFCGKSHPNIYWQNSWGPKQNDTPMKATNPLYNDWRSGSASPSTPSTPISIPRSRKRAREEEENDCQCVSVDTHPRQRPWVRSRDITDFWKDFEAAVASQEFCHQTMHSRGK